MSIILDRITQLEEKRRNILSNRTEYDDVVKQFILEDIADELATLWDQRRCEMQHCIRKAAPMSKQSRGNYKGWLTKKS